MLDKREGVGLLFDWLTSQEQGGWELQPIITSALACPGLRSGVGPRVVRWQAEIVPRRSEALVTPAEEQRHTPVMKPVLTTSLGGWRTIPAKYSGCQK